MAFGFDAISETAISGEVVSTALPFVSQSLDDSAAVRRRESGVRGDAGIIANVLLGALALVAGVVGAPRAVNASPVWQRHQIQVDTPPNLLTSTLAASAAVLPFTPVDWPTIIKARAVQDTNVPNLTLAPGTAVVPLRQTDWPTIPKARVVQDTNVAVPVALLSARPFAQFDWPVQTKARVAQDTNVPNVTTALASIGAAAPYTLQNDWPIIPKARVIQDTNVPNNTAALPSLAVPAAPFAQFDWPVQTKARVAQDTNVPNVTAATLPIVPAAHYTLQNDWPVIPKARVIQDTNVPNNTAATLVIVPLSAQTRAPLITHVAQRHQIQVDIPPNLLVGVFGPVQLPFQQSDFPVITKARTIQDTNVPNYLLLAALVPPVVQTDWPFQVSKNRAAADANVQDTNVPNVALVSTVAAPFAQFDWPVQTKARTVQDTNVPNPALLQPLVAPLAQFDWPIITKARVVQDTNTYNLAVGVGRTIPFGAYDWPVITKARVVQDTNIAQGAIYGTLAQPFAQFDWPVQTKARVVQDTNVPNLLLATQLSQPVTPPDFAPAVRRKDGQLDTLPNLLASTFAIPPSTFPFGLYDWPVITKARVVQETNLYNAVIYPTLTAPAIPVDFGQVWRRRDGQLDTLPNATATTLSIPSSVFPFVQVDWPVQTKARVVQDTNLINGVLLATLTVPVTPPDFAPAVKRRDGQVDVLPNLAASTLALPTPPPFVNPDLAAVALKGRSAQQVDAFGNPTAALPAAQTLPPVAGIDLASVFKRRDSQADAQGAAILLLAVLAPAAPDWGQPAARRRPQTDIPGNLLASTLAALPARSMLDTGAISKGRAVQDTNAPNATLFALPPYITRPQDFGQWQRRKDGALDVLPNATLTTLRLPPTVKPFTQTDWPLPTRAKFYAPDYVANTLGNALSGRLVGEARFIISGTARAFTASRGKARAFAIARAQGRAFKVSSIMSQTFESKDPSESVKLTFDFTPDLSTLAGVLLTGVSSVTATDTMGRDSTPALLLNGAAALDPTSLKVIVPVTGGLNQSKYNIRVVASTSDPFTTLELTGVLPVSV